MRLDGPDTWGNKAREIRTLLVQRWKDCYFSGIEDLPSWPEIEARSDLATLRDLERRLEKAAGRGAKPEKKRRVS